MQQRVAIARGLAYRPEILLMDEPFASVDAQTRADLEDLVLQIRHDYGVTILFVTHDIDESVYLADRVVILSQRPTVVQETLDVPLPRPRDQVDHEGAARVRAAARARLPRHQAPDGATSPPAQAGVSGTDVYDALHAAIVAGELSPGERLVEEELAERLGRSRGAVREAILRARPRRARRA